MMLSSAGLEFASSSSALKGESSKVAGSANDDPISETRCFDGGVAFPDVTLHGFFVMYLTC